MKKLDDFKEKMNQKFIAITPHIPMVDFREMGKKLYELTKTFQNWKDRFNKSTESLKRYQAQIPKNRKTIQNAYTVEMNNMKIV